MSAALMNGRRVTVETDDDVVLAEQGWYTEGLRRLPDGTLIVRGQTWRAAERPPRLWQRISRDEGRTWSSPPALPPGVGPDYAAASNPFLLQRRDGRVVGWAGPWNLSTEYHGRPGQPVVHQIVRAASWAALLHSSRETIPAPITIPYMTPLVGDDFRMLYTPALWGQMVETEDGYLIQAAYPVFVCDRMPRLWENQTGFAPQYRTIVIYSQDDGATWHYLATVAATDRYRLPPQAEGYCEPDLLYLGNGHLLCVMRSGGNPAGFGQERYTPLMASHSYDGGLSWDPPYPIAAYGVKPMLLQMSNGLIVCLAGRPGFFLLFSADQGRTWSTPYWISQQHGPWGESPSGYGALLELEPGVLAISYDEYSSSGSDARMVSRSRRCRITIK